MSDETAQQRVLSETLMFCGKDSLGWVTLSFGILNACSLLHILPLIKILDKNEILIFLVLAARGFSSGRLHSQALCDLGVAIPLCYFTHPICGQTNYSSHPVFTRSLFL